MRKTLSFFSLAACLIAAFVFSGSVFAEDKGQSKAGKVIAVDGKSFTIKTTAGDASFTAKRDILDKLVIEQEVEVTYTKDEQGNSIASGFKPVSDSKPVQEPEKGGNSAEKPGKAAGKTGHGAEKGGHKAEKLEKGTVQEKGNPSAPGLTKNGRIESINPGTGNVTINIPGTRDSLTFTLKKDLLKDLKKGLFVQITFVKENGSRVATKVEVLKTH